MDKPRHPNVIRTWTVRRPARDVPRIKNEIDRQNRKTNGVEIMVPPFVKSGDTIRLSLSDMKYMDRAKAKSS